MNMVLYLFLINMDSCEQKSYILVIIWKNKNLIIFFCFYFKIIIILFKIN